MTATAESASEEFSLFFGLKTVVFPPHRTCGRTDHPDVVFTHRRGEDRRARGGNRAGPRHATPDPRRHRERARVGGACRGAVEPRRPLHGPQREAGRARGGDDRRRRRARRRHDLDEHGRSGHRHPPWRTGRSGSGCGRRPRRALRDRHEPPREPAHRQPATRARRTPGRSRLVALLHRARRRLDPAVRRDLADPEGPPPVAAAATHRRRRRERARSPGPSESSKDRTSRSGGRCGSTRPSSTTSGRSSTGGVRSSSTATPIPVPASSARRKNTRRSCGRWGRTPCAARSSA